MSLHYFRVQTKRNRQQAKGPNGFPKFRKLCSSKRYLLNAKRCVHRAVLRELEYQLPTNKAVKIAFLSWLKPNDILVSGQTKLAALWQRTANKLADATF